MRGPRLIASGFALLLGLSLSMALAGEIVTTGATIESGSPGAPGLVIIDPDAPSAAAAGLPTPPPMGGLGDPTVPFPDWPGGRAGTQVLRFDTSTVLPRGVYRVASLYVGPDAEVTFTRGAVVRSAGPVTVLGSLRTTFRGRLRIVCDGELRIGPDGEINTDGGDLEIDAGGDICAEPGSRITGGSGTFRLAAHARNEAQGNVVLRGAQIAARSGLAVMQAAGSVSIGEASHFGSTSGAVLIHASGGDVEMTEGSDVHFTSTSPWIRVEASGSVTLTGHETKLRATGGEICVRSFGGDIAIESGATARLTGGDIDVAAAGAITIDGPSAVSHTAGTTRIRAFGGDIVVQSPGGESSLRTTSGEISLESAASVHLADGGAVTTGSGTVCVIAHGGDVTLAPSAGLSVETLLVIADGALRMPGGTIYCDDAVLAAEQGPLEIGADHTAWVSGDVTLVSSGVLQIRGQITARGRLDVASLDDDVDIAGAFLDASNASSQPAGQVHVTSYAGADGGIDATGTVLRSRGATGTGNAVVLNVRAGRIEPSPEPSISVEALRIRRRAKRPERSTIVASGTIDLPYSQFTAGLASVKLMDLSLPLGLQRKRTQLRGHTPGLRLTLRRRGSASTHFRIRYRGVVSDYVSANGTDPVVVGLCQEAIDVITSVDLIRDRLARARAGN